MTLQLNGRSIEARPGDTVASALYRAGQRIFTRSFKFHRPRGLLCLAGKCPNCMMNVDGTPNSRACVTPARDGMRVRHRNAWPTLDHDALSIAQRFDWLMPVGWSYKAFTHPKIWDAYQSYCTKGTLPTLEQIAGHTVDLFPQLHGIRVLRQWAGVYDMTPDYAPIIGVPREVENFYQDVGWGTYGFKAAPIAAKCTAKLIATGKTPDLIAPFSPVRFHNGRLLGEKAAAAVS